jgi:hypothetical protein
MEILRHTLPGSWLPLALMMAIFFTKYGAAVAVAREPALVNMPLFIGGVSILYGVWSGLFFARLLRVLRTQRRRRSVLSDPIAHAPWASLNPLAVPEMRKWHA